MDPQILDVRGIEIEIVMFRGTANIFEAFLANPDGTPVNLEDSNVTMTIVDRMGGAVKYTQTNGPAGSPHFDAANGLTRFNIPASATTGLTGQRAYTWKHQVVRYYVPTGSPIPYFYGDVRVVPPPAAV